jgi:uncharacterized protein (DUF1684 family)
MQMRRTLTQTAGVAALAAAAVLAGASDAAKRAPGERAPLAYADSIASSREARVARLRSDTGWLTVAGLFWLSPGDNAFGADSSNAIVLPPGSAPPRAGVFRLEASGQVVLRAEPGAGLRLADTLVAVAALRGDDADEPDVVTLDPRLRFFVIRRGGRPAIRMRDLESSIRTGFRGVDFYPIDPALRIDAEFVPLDPPRRIPVPNIAGYADSMTAPGVLRFALGGAACTLTPVHESPEDSTLFIIFADETTEIETYGGGRFLYADPPRDGRVTLDFNRAYNPPCAFTPFTTCPLPPEGNDLPVAVRAGEKKYAGHE